MEVTCVNPGADYMIERIMDFQTEAESAFWSEPLYHFYPQLDKAYAISLPFQQRKLPPAEPPHFVFHDFQQIDPCAGVVHLCDFLLIPNNSQIHVLHHIFHLVGQVLHQNDCIR